jgi:hypothetical protein
MTISLLRFIEFKALKRLGDGNSRAYTSPKASLKVNLQLCTGERLHEYLS